MKKFMMKVALLLCATTATIGMSSCNEDTMKIALGILEQLAEQAQAQQGTTYNFVGTAQARLLIYSAKDEAYGFATPNGAYKSMSMTLPVTLSSTAASMVIPTITVDGATMTGAQMGNLTNTTSGNTATIMVNDNTTGAGTLTINGQSYNIYRVWLENCKYTNDGAFNGGPIQIFFGENGEYVMDMKFTGKYTAQ